MVIEEAEEEEDASANFTKSSGLQLKIMTSPKGRKIDISILEEDELDEDLDDEEPIIEVHAQGYMAMRGKRSSHLTKSSMGGSQPGSTKHKMSTGGRSNDRLDGSMGSINEEPPRFNFLNAVNKDNESSD